MQEHFCKQVVCALVSIQDVPQSLHLADTHVMPLRYHLVDNRLSQYLPRE